MYVYYVGNLFGVVDGVVVVLLVLFEYVKVYDMKLCVCIVVIVNMGDLLILMLNVLVFVVKKVLEKVNLIKDDIDFWEINEVFLVVVEKFI